MKIIEIKLHGFKSFADKTTIKFDDNLIGIVGPNGSGKSNVIDAIKWVLGEQKSKSMRAKSSTDVIFVGTDSKKAMNFAEVTIVFDNQDHYLNVEYTEVAITRRLYKTGESEYFLNKNKCRLKDINDLVMDKGFGKNSFSIISQGKIEEIIMAKPEVRREIVEEVAGVLKYKNKKELAIKKLNITLENLNKINFIFEQIQEQVIPLQKASEKAQKYQELNEEYQKKDIQLLATEIRETNEYLDHIRLENLEYQKNDNELNTEIENILKKEQVEIEAIKKFSIEEKTIREQLLNIQEETLIKKSRIELIQERNILYASEGNNQKRIQILVDKIRDNESLIKNIEKELIKTKPKLIEEQRIINKYKIEILEIQNKITSSKNEQFKLEEIESKNQYPYAVKQLLDENIQGIINIVGNLYNSSHETNLAISTIIGMRKNELVTDNEITAKKCIEILKTKKLGRVTIIPLNKIKPRFIKENDLKTIKESNHFLGVATDFIQIEPKYQKVFASLLGTTILCRTIEDAYIGLKKLTGNYQLVTLEGDIVNNSGKVTGGYDKKINKYNTKEQIIKLKKSIEELENEIFEKQTNLDQKIRNKRETEIDFETNEAYFKNKNSELEENKTELKQLQPSDNQNKGDGSKIQEELKKLIQSENETFEKLETIKSQIETCEKIKEELNTQLTKIRSEEKINNQKLNETKMKLVQSENLISTSLDRLREEHNISYEGALRTLTNNINIDETRNRLRKLKKEINELGFVNLDAIKEYSEKKTLLEEYQNHKEDLTKSRDKIIQIIDRLDEFVITQFKEAHTKLNIEFGKIYQQLFDGGIAELVLTNPENILETGIEIIARPPGKKSQVIGLLSGGEKALTAIALLFSIIKVRVIPFAILDEVEAALDESNVERYATYLQIFSKKTQFLVITHRQGTMAKVERLYGVTMPQKGISKVLNIDLKEKNV